LLYGSLLGKQIRLEPLSAASKTIGLLDLHRFENHSYMPDMLHLVVSKLVVSFSYQTVLQEFPVEVRQELLAPGHRTTQPEK
jgi:hypothetical protein